MTLGRNANIQPRSTRPMAKYDGIRGQVLLEVEERENELVLIFQDNRYLFVRVENGKLVAESVPE